MRVSTKDEYEKQEEEAERLVKPSPGFKPPRDDKTRNHVDTGDPDLNQDDPDLSLNYKDIGGRVCARYRGVVDQSFRPGGVEKIVDGSDLDIEDMKEIAAAALEWWGRPFMEDLVVGGRRDPALRVALDHAIWTSKDGCFRSAVDTQSYALLLDVLDRVIPR